MAKLALADVYRVQNKTAEAEKLLREGCLLWDMGLNDEAKGKWRKALEFAPHRMDIHHFLEDAEREEVSATQALHPSQMPRDASALPKRSSAHRLSRTGTHFPMTA